MDIITNATVIANAQGLIEDVGDAAQLEQRYASTTFARDIDCRGMCVLPGLVDAHTHPVWSGDRVHEFAMKLAGASYLEIHGKGGGIGFTVNATRESSEEVLEALLVERLDRMLRAGTTLVEGKSGYGLDVETELKMLRVLKRVSERHPVEIVSTFLVHSVPKGKTRQEQADDVVQH